jgi:hypothetical protein
VLTYDTASGNWVNSTSPAGVTDHGALTGLTDDDHTAYVLADGSRAFSGTQVTIGVGAAGVDYRLLFDGESNDGYIEFNEDDARFVLNRGVSLPDAYAFIVGNGSDGKIYSSADNVYIDNITSDKDIIFRINDGGTTGVLVTLDGSESKVGVGTTAPGATLDVATSYRLQAAATTTDGDYNGTWVVGTAGENLTNGKLVYLKSDGKWWQTDADAEATAGGVMLGLCVGTINADATGRILLGGTFAETDWNWTVGQALYVSTASGTLTATKPSGTSDIVRPVGYAYNADAIFFCPSQTWVTIV